MTRKKQSKVKQNAGASASGVRAAGKSAGKGAAPDLSHLREGIDQADRQIIRWLNRRSDLVVKVGKLKRAAGIPIYAPHRESEVLARHPQQGMQRAPSNL